MSMIVINNSHQILKLIKCWIYLELSVDYPLFGITIEVVNYPPLTNVMIDVFL